MNIDDLGRLLLQEGKPVDTGHWQSIKGVPQTKTVELTNAVYQLGLPKTKLALEGATRCNVPWAELQFQERVGGVPLNPGETYKLWPWYRPSWEAQAGRPPLVREQDWAYIAGFIDGEGTIDVSKGHPRIHIYQKDPQVLKEIQSILGIGRLSSRVQSSQLSTDTEISLLCITNRLETQWVLPHLIPHLRVKKNKALGAYESVKEITPHGNHKPLPLHPRFSHTYMQRFWPRDLGGGIEFRYGDLNDVIALLAREPYTRQAYLPIFFPEDTGAHHGERIPCTLGYHLFMREGFLHINYFIRSCDFLRHFRDDVYMAGRLCQWVLNELDHDLEVGQPDHGWENVVPGVLTMFMSSLHVFEGDLPKMRKLYA